MFHILTSREKSEYTRVIACCTAAGQFLFPVLLFENVNNKKVSVMVFPQGQIRGYIQNIPDWCCHLYSSCGSAKHRQVLGLLCLMCQCAKLHVAGWTWAVFTHVCLLCLWFLQRQSGIFWIYPRMYMNRKSSSYTSTDLLMWFTEHFLKYRASGKVILLWNDHRSRCKIMRGDQNSLCTWWLQYKKHAKIF
jgi:hypothetical protein